MSLINQSGRLRNSRFKQQIDVRRQSQILSITAIVIPTSPNDVLLLPESERYLPSLKLFTNEPLERGDLVQYKGIDYCIKTLANWSDYGYYYQIGVRHLPTAKGDSGGFTIT